MRRLVSLAILVLWCLGPVCALLPGSDEAQLPACCRRHGAHHCMMSRAALDRVFASGRSVGAPAHCPLYRTSSPASASVFVLPTPSAIAHTAETRAEVAEARRPALHQAYTAASRGPPAVL